MDWHKEFLQCLDALSYSRDKWDAFRDFLDISYGACAYGIIEESEAIEIEKIFDRYNEKERELLDRMFVCINEYFKENYSDFLGEVFHAAELHSSWHGQFFTPFTVSYFMAQAVLANVEEVIEKKGYFTLMEPACGSGGMVLAAARVVKEKGYEPSEVLYFRAQDIDDRCFKMAYIQTTVARLSGHVVLGDSLKLETRKVTPTPWLLTSGLAEKIANETKEEKTVKIEFDQDLYNAWKQGVLFPVEA